MPDAWLRDAKRELLRFRTGEELRASGFWRSQGAEIEKLLATVQDGSPPQPIPPTARRETLRIVHWNILKGIEFESIVRVLREHDMLRDADVILLNEVDVGTARAANRHVAAELAEALGLHWAFVPSYLELTQGPGADVDAPGENEVGLHGVACLTREPPVALSAVPLPDSFDYFAHAEKRLGRRTALLAVHPDGFVFGAAHLEVRGTPRGRAKQMAALLDGVERLCARQAEAGQPVQGVVLAGDLNTHTFPRGSAARALRGFFRLLLTPPGMLKRQLREPWRANREPAFAELRRRGYDLTALNDDGLTAWACVAAFEECDWLPRGTRRWLARRLEPEPGGIPLRLDWFMGKNVERCGEACTVVELLNAQGPSDHAPLVLEIAMPPVPPTRA